MTELEQVKQESYKTLIRLGFEREFVKKFVDSYEKITGYFNGKPSRVLTTSSNGEKFEIYL